MKTKITLRPAASAFGKWRPTRRTASASDGRCNAASAPSLVFRAHVCGTSGDTGGHHTPLPSGSICLNPFARTRMVRCRNDMLYALDSYIVETALALVACMVCCVASTKFLVGGTVCGHKAVLDRLNADYCYWRHSLLCMYYYLICTSEDKESAPLSLLLALVKIKNTKKGERGRPDCRQHAQTATASNKVYFWLVQQHLHNPLFK